MLTVPETIAMLNDIVAEKPDDYQYINDPKTLETRNQKKAGATVDCFYQHFDGTPGCIVGVLVNKLNPEFDLSSVENKTVRRVLSAANIPASSDAIQLLGDCQDFQDNGDTWKDAVSKAKDINGWH